MILFLIIVICVQFLVLLAAFSKLANKKYDGTFIVKETEDKKIVTMEWATDPNFHLMKNAVRFKVDRASDLARR